MSFIARRTFARAASRNVARAGPRAPLYTSRLAQQSSSSPATTLPTPHTTLRTFSSSKMVQASAGDAFAAPAPPAEFDKEIVDMASYIHNYKIDSELAVCCYCIPETVEFF